MGKGKKVTIDGFNLWVQIEVVYQDGSKFGDSKDLPGVDAGMTWETKIGAFGPGQTEEMIDYLASLGAYDQDLGELREVLCALEANPNSLIEEEP